MPIQPAQPARADPARTLLLSRLHSCVQSPELSVSLLVVADRKQLRRRVQPSRWNVPTPFVQSSREAGALMVGTARLRLGHRPVKPPHVVQRAVCLAQLMLLRRDTDAQRVVCAANCHCVAAKWHLVTWASAGTPQILSGRCGTCVAYCESLCVPHAPVSAASRRQGHQPQPSPCPRRPRPRRSCHARRSRTSRPNPRRAPR